MKERIQSAIDELVAIIDRLEQSLKQRAELERNRDEAIARHQEHQSQFRKQFEKNSEAVEENARFWDAAWWSLFDDRAKDVILKVSRDKHVRGHFLDPDAIDFTRPLTASAKGFLAWLLGLAFGRSDVFTSEHTLKPAFHQNPEPLRDWLRRNDILLDDGTIDSDALERVLFDAVSSGSDDPSKS